MRFSIPATSYTRAIYAAFGANSAGRLAFCLVIQQPGTSYGLVANLSRTRSFWSRLEPDA